MLTACVPYTVPIFGDSADASCAPPDTVRLGEVLDGDTFTLSTGETVRLLGVDTPEVYLDEENPSGDCEAGQYIEDEGVCCYGPQASDFLRRALSGSSGELRLEYDHICQDEYGRQLAYAYLLPEEEEDSGESSDEEEVFLNEEILKGGYGRVYTADPSIRRYEEFISLESQARESGFGLWGACL